MLEEWEQQLGAHPLYVRLGEPVTDIPKTNKFRVEADQRSYQCDRVILRVGKLIYLAKLDVSLEAQGVLRATRARSILRL